RTQVCSTCPPARAVVRSRPTTTSDMMIGRTPSLHRSCQAGRSGNFASSPGDGVQCSRVGLAQVERAALANVGVVTIQPLESALSPEITKLLEEGPGCIETRSSREGVQLCPAMDAVHQ